MRTYREVANSPEIASAVIEQLGLAWQPSDLMSRVTVSSTAGTAVLVIEVRDSSPQRATYIANAIALQLPPMIDRLETPQGVTRSPVRVSVVRPAEVPTGPDSPQPVTSIAMGLLAGLVVGSAAGIVWYTKDSTVRDAEQAARTTQVPLVGKVPADGHLRGPIADGAATAELYLQIRTNLRLLCAGSRLGSLTVAATAPDDGTHGVTAHLALAFAAAGETVVIVDGDLRRPTIAGSFDIPAEPGLAEVLRGEIAITHAPLRWHDNLRLFVLPRRQGFGSRRRAAQAQGARGRDRGVALDWRDRHHSRGAAFDRRRNDDFDAPHRRDRPDRPRRNDALRPAFRSGASAAADRSEPDRRHRRCLAHYRKAR